WVISRAEPHVSIRLKQLFPAIPKAAVPPYHLPHTLVADTDLDWFLQRYPLDISDADRGELTSGREAFLRQQAEMERILMPDYVPTGGAALREGQQLRPYQWQAIEVLRRRGRLLLGDEGGLGKTYTAAGFMVAEPGALPAAVVCDAHMQRQWREKV